jgi:hypothetical protein
LDLRAASSHTLVTCLALQASQILRGLDKVAWGHPRSPGLWIRSSGPLAGQQDFLIGRAHLAGTSRTLVGGDTREPMSLKVPPQRKTTETKLHNRNLETTSVQQGAV